MKFLDHVQGSNCAEWECEDCGRFWVAPHVPTCLCVEICRPVKTKHDFVRRYQLGHFGNRAPTWDNVGDFLKSGYVGLVHIRNRIAGGPTWYDVPHDLVDMEWYSICYRSRLAKPENLYLSGMAPTSKTTLQGEVFQNPDGTGLTLFYTTVAKPMRQALAEKSEQVSGVKAVMLLRSAMNAVSYDWLQVLLDRYPNHVIEFSAYDCEWGTIPGYNCVVWEVRTY